MNNEEKMEPYDPKKQSGDLEGAIDKAKEKRSKKPSRKKKLLIGAGLIALGAIAWGSCSPVPPHEERVTYIKNALYDDCLPRLTSPYFNGSEACVSSDGEGGKNLINLMAKVSLYPERSLRIFGLIDVDSSDKGDIDEIILIEGSEDGFECLVEYHALPESLQERVGKHYKMLSENVYRSLNGSLLSKIAHRNGIGKDGWNELAKFCEENGEEIDFTEFEISSLMQLAEE